MNHAQKRKVLLNPGDFLFAEPGTHIHTLLGSCIAITLWHPKLQIGGMCHYLLPERPDNEKNNNNKPSGRYGEEAMQLFELAAELHGTKLSQYQAKIFGGSDTFFHTEKNDSTLIGKRNTDKAAQMLILRNIDIMVAHVGENGSRRIVMDLNNGDVWVKHTNENGQVFSSTSGIS